MRLLVVVVDMGPLLGEDSTLLVVELVAEVGWLNLFNKVEEVEEEDKEVDKEEELKLW
jgi:hypothetical protein